MVAEEMGDDVNGYTPTGYTHPVGVGQHHQNF